MEWIFIIVGAIMLIIVISYAYNLGIIEQLGENVVEKSYEKRNFMTKTELNFYNKIKELETEYKIVPQINLATIIKKINKGYINELFKNVDFAIFDKEYKNLLLLIELNDNTHNKPNRKDRDLKVKKICRDANINLITFYTNYPNENNYVINRIKKEISKYYEANNN